MIRHLFGIVLTASLLSIPTEALAQARTWTLGQIVLSSANVPYAPLGVGAPSVALDEHSGTRFLETFEYPATAANPLDPVCPSGIWGIGIARSPNGIAWTTMDGDNDGGNGISPLIVPVPGAGTEHDCVMAQPSILWGDDPTGKFFWVAYKAQDDSGSNFTGIGMLEIELFGNGNIKTVTDHGLVLPMTDIGGYSDFKRECDGSYSMAVQRKVTGVLEYEMWEATSPTPDVLWTLAPSPSVSPSAFALPYMENEVASFEYFHDDWDPLDGFDETHIMFIGRTLALGGAFVTGGIAEMVRVEDGVSVFELPATPEITISTSTAYRHIGLIQLDVAGDQQFIMYTSELSGGVPRIRVAYTDPLPGFPGTFVVPKSCN